MPGYATVEMILGLKDPDPEKVKAAEEAAVEQARKDLGWTYEFIEIGEIATIDQMMKELDVLERLDAMIDKCVKQLLLLRSLKSLTPPSQAAQPARIPPRPTEAA